MMKRGRCGEMETDKHILFECGIAQEVWEEIGGGSGLTEVK